jgi:uncharacterized membrane protein YgdD (TMEM256/DUF423 family)
MSARVWIFFGALLGAVGVSLGAYHAHGLEKLLGQRGLPADELQRQMQNFDVGVRYEIYHALALVLVGLLAWRASSVCIHASGLLFLLGTVLFCGGLYVPVLAGTKLPWYLVPGGGLAFIFGWVMLAGGAICSPAGE